MGHLTVHNLDDSLVELLQSRAAAHGRTVEEEHRAILEEVLVTQKESDFWERMAARRARLAGRSFPDATALVRQMRDERAGIVSEQPE